MDNQMQPQMDQPMSMNTTPVNDGAPYFMGDHALIQFSRSEEGMSPQTFWLVDKSNHTIRPFESHMALDAAFGSDLQSALQNSVTVTPPMMDSEGNVTEGVLKDFSILGPEYAIREDGTSKALHFSNHQLKSRYGKPIDTKAEALATEVLDGFLNLLKSNEAKTGIPAKFINEMRADSKLMAFYISSMAYGDYTMADIYSDISHSFDESK
jgi:hypothetical protein